MNNNEYIELAQVTNTIDYKDGMGRFLVAEILGNIIEAGGALDAVKKFQFYGRETEETQGLLDVQTHSAIYSTDDWCDMIDFNKLFPNLSRESALKVYHGVIGKITEAVELAEMLRESLLTGEPVDTTNLIEEVGDGMWYDASIAKGLNTPLEAFQTINIEKLKKRFGGKFDAHKAQQENRDLDAERKILEGGVGNDLPARVQRMLAEYSELGNKARKLAVFINSDMFETLSANEQQLMYDQHHGMCVYMKALNSRIEIAIANEG
ncbi:MazG-like pyrophosphatase [Stenotrophomonas phage BUCT626]|uniref:MazG-related protein n=1 Tax=Stenotrophomonas phage BUCT626 TaxID=2860376 RepID=A0AC61NA67_9CAUD|nr:MazG-like pyrophosphatase [Stenotrophomonas phage BUCT626]QYC96772.1 MazG-related protein [Stenotrophomonas phage BUCT626]